MRSQFLQYAVLLFVTLLFSASGSLLRGDQAIRSPRLVEKKNESSQSDKAGKKSNSSADSKKSKRKKEETKGDNPPTSSAMSEKGVQQIVHSHHPKAATVDEGTDEKYGKKSKGQRKDSMKQQEKGEFSVPDDEHDEQGAVKFDNGNTDIHEQVLSRASRTQHQSLYDENEDRHSTIAERPVDVLAVEYNTMSVKLPTEVEYLYLVHLTVHLLSSMYSRTFENVEMVHFEGMEVRHFKSISPRLIQFEVSALFQQREGTVVPSLGQVKDVVQQGLAEEGDFYFEYLAALEQMPFEVFSTTNSFRVITGADELQQLIGNNSGEDDKPRIILILATVLAVLSVSIFAVAWFRGHYKKAEAKFLEEEEGKYDIAPKPAAFKTATFDDPITDDGYFIDEADVENTGTKNLVEVNLWDDSNKAPKKESKSIQKSVWTSDDESSTMTSNHDEGQISTSDASQRSADSISEGSIDSAIASLQDWLFTQSKPVGPPANGEARTDLEEDPPENRKRSLFNFKQTEDTAGEHDKQNSRLDSPDLSVYRIREEYTKSSIDERHSVPSSEIKSHDETKPIWMTRRLRHVHQPQKDGNAMADQNHNHVEIMSSTRSKAVPLWMQKRQEVMQQSEQRLEQSDEQKPPVQPAACDSSTGARKASMSLVASDVLMSEETKAQVGSAQSELGSDETTLVANKTEVMPSTRSKAVPLWMQKRQEVMQQSEQRLEQSDEQKPPVQPAACDSSTGARKASMSLVASDVLMSEETKAQVGSTQSELTPLEQVSVPHTLDTLPSTTERKEIVLKSAQPSAQKDIKTTLVERAASESPSKDQSSTMTVADSDLPMAKEATDQVGPAHNELSPNVPAPLPSKVEATSDMNGKALPLWMQKRREIMQESAQRPKQNDEENLLVESGATEDRRSTMTLPASDLPTGDAFTDQNSNKIEADFGTNDKDVPLWMTKRQEILQLNEEESVHEEEFDAPTDAPEWMTRFKQMDKDE